MRIPPASLGGTAAYGERINPIAADQSTRPARCESGGGAIYLAVRLPVGIDWAGPLVKRGSWTAPGKLESTPLGDGSICDRLAGRSVRMIIWMLIPSGAT